MASVIAPLHSVASLLPRVRDDIACLQAFLPVWFNRFTAMANPGNTFCLGGMSDSYYEYLLKVWLLKGKQAGPLLLACMDPQPCCGCDRALVLVPGHRTAPASSWNGIWCVGDAETAL